MSGGHTAGPWVENGNSDWYPDQHEGAGDTSWVVIRSEADDVDVAIVMVTPKRWNDDRRWNDRDHWSDRTDLDANARLIAAAPDLLAALEGLMETVEAQYRHGIKWDPAQVDDARAAIARTKTGEA